MALSASEIAGHSALHPVVRRQAQALLAAYQSSPRLSSVFATQQRWLMAHAGLVLYFRQGSITTARFLQLVERHSVASRNTADAFIKEMLQYNYVEPVPDNTDRRSNPLRPTTEALQTLAAWAMVHLMSLDAFDGGERAAIFGSRPDALARLEPLIAEGLLTSDPVRVPEKTFSLFTWLNNGGVVMEWLISGVEPSLADQDRIPTGVLSIGEFANLLKLSRTHLARKLREAEGLGSLGWLGQRGHSTMWVSRDFYREYMDAQAVKLAIIDHAFDQGLANAAA